MKAIRIVGVLLIALLLGANSYAAEKSLLDQVLERGTLRVGVSEFVPWVMRDKTGKLVGFEVDVARRLAKDMGVKVEFVPTQWSGIIPALLTGKFDVIIGGMGIRPDRNIKVNFSIPYDYSGVSIVANSDKAKGFDSLNDFNKPGIVIASRLGTSAASAAKKFLPKAQHRMFDDEAQAVQEVLNGRAHAFVSSAPTPAFLAYKNKNKLFLPFKDTFTKEPIGFALRKGDIDSLNYFNSWIRIATLEGWLQERHNYWFGGRDWESQIQ